jgi:hypothetical protein
MKAIRGYEGFYSVESDGRVWTHRRNKYLNPGSGSSGYLSVTITRDGKPKAFSIHRLVAMAFIDNPEGKPQVNHKDGNKLNNSADNLEWVTNSENMRHAVKSGLYSGGVSSRFKRGFDHKRKRKFTDSQVIDMRNRWAGGESFEEINKTYNVSSSSIRRVCKGESYAFIM